MSYSSFIEFFKWDITLKLNRNTKNIRTSVVRTVKQLVVRFRSCSISDFSLEYPDWTDSNLDSNSRNKSYIPVRALWMDSANFPKILFCDRIRSVIIEWPLSKFTAREYISEMSFLLNCANDSVILTKMIREKYFTKHWLDNISLCCVWNNIHAIQFKRPLFGVKNVLSSFCFLH